MEWTCAGVSPEPSVPVMVPSGASRTNCTEAKSPALATTASSLRKETLVSPAWSEKVREMAWASRASSSWAVDTVARRMST